MHMHTTTRLFHTILYVQIDFYKHSPLVTSSKMKPFANTNKTHNCLNTLDQKFIYTCIAIIIYTTNPIAQVTIHLHALCMQPPCIYNL